MQVAGRFRRTRRLRRPADFKRVFHQPCRSVDGCFTILFRANSLLVPRLGLAITRRRIRGAVARHRIKRHVRESFRMHQNLLSGLDLVVLARADLRGATNDILRASLAWHWREIHERRCNAS